MDSSGRGDASHGRDKEKGTGMGSGGDDWGEGGDEEEKVATRRRGRGAAGAAATGRWWVELLRERTGREGTGVGEGDDRFPLSS
jgi:hypothetical protein